MKYYRNIFYFLLALFLGGAGHAWAFFWPIPLTDVEAPQGFMKNLMAVDTAPAMSLLEDYRKVEKAISWVSGGGFGTVVKDLNKYKSKVISMGMDKYGVKVPTYLGKDLFNPIKAKDILMKEQTLTIGAGNETKVYNDTVVKSNLLVYEEAASLYGIALSTHAKILDQEQEPDSAKEMNNRDLVQATTDKAVETSVRLSRILLLESNIANYRMGLQQKAYTIMQEPKEDDQSSPQAGEAS